MRVVYPIKPNPMYDYKARKLQSAAVVMVRTCSIQRDIRSATVVGPNSTPGNRKSTLLTMRRFFLVFSAWEPHARAKDYG